MQRPPARPPCRCKQAILLCVLLIVGLHQEGPLLLALDVLCLAIVAAAGRLTEGAVGVLPEAWQVLQLAEGADLILQIIRKL